MGWFSDPEATGERTARMRGENADRQHQNARSRDDINYRRSREAEYENKNWQHKTLAFEAEQRIAAREGRLPIYMSPAMVPDMPRPFLVPEYAGPPASRDNSGGGISWMGLLAIGGILIFFVIPLILSMIAPVLQWIVQALGTILLIGGAALTVLWLVLHFTAKDDPAKIHRAKLFNPIRVAKVLWSFGAEWLAARRARKNGQ